MNGLELLRQDHDNVRELFEEFRTAASDDNTQVMEEVCARIFDELETHTAIEEEVFYPAVRDAGGKELGEHTDESKEEHHVVDVLMNEIRELDVGDRAFKAKMLVLIENVEHHAEEEEQEMFPQVGELMSEDRLQTLGEELQEAKTRHQAKSSSKKELQDQAREAGVEGRSSMSKEELAEEIQKQS